MKVVHVDVECRQEAKELCPWAKYMSKAASGWWMFDNYEAWIWYESN
jgi:hypothetical protein